MSAHDSGHVLMFQGKIGQGFRSFTISTRAAFPFLAETIPVEINSSTISSAVSPRSGMVSNWHCAFCKDPFESLDHFVPVSRGGASWVGNVVPACLRCQTAKGNLLPEEVEFIPKDRMDMIARYLERRAKTATP